VALPLCATAGGFGCARGVQQTPLPTLSVDLGEYGDDLPRRAGAYDTNTSSAQLVLRARIKLTAPVVLRHDNVDCQVSIDSTNYGAPDVTLALAVTGSGDGPLTVAGYSFDGLDDGTITEAGDIVFGPNRWCNYWAHSRFAEVHSWLGNVLFAWAQREGALCGAPEPYYWQRCPPS
jgi:hypothetical protein